MDRRITLHTEQLRNRDTARRGDPTQVVPDQVDDHQVLGAVLFAVLQLGADELVGGGVIPDRPGALDR